MSIVFTVFAALFGAKLAWNISVPLWLRRGDGVSLHTHIEIALLVGMMLVTARPVLVAAVGVLAIAASYGGAFVLGMLLGWRYRPPS
jgi:drug/metabolite transporter superfamily protein YnfA